MRNAFSIFEELNGVPRFPNISIPAFNTKGWFTDNFGAFTFDMA